MHYKPYTDGDEQDRCDAAEMFIEAILPLANAWLEMSAALDDKDASAADICSVGYSIQARGAVLPFGR